MGEGFRGGVPRLARIFGRAMLLSAAAIALPLPAQAADPTQKETEEWIKTLDPLLDGDWEWVTWGPGTAVYASLRNSQREGATATAWLRWEYLAVHQDYGVSYKSMAARTQFDCLRGASRILSVTLYDNNSLRGASHTFARDKPPTWEPDVPGTLGEAVARVMCRKTRPHPVPKPK